MPAETAWQARKRREQERAAYIAAHGNVCELCGESPKTRGLSEDHDHRTGKRRGWLCFRCNRALPVYVTLEWLRRAVDYLERVEDARECSSCGHPKSFHETRDGGCFGAVCNCGAFVGA